MQGKISMTVYGPERVLYNVRYLFQTMREVPAIFVKEVLIRRKNTFRLYLKERLVFYDVGRIKKKYSSKIILWIHGHTLGDMRNAVRLAEILKGNNSEISIIASTSECATYDIVKGIIPEFDEVVFLPFDIPILINKVFKRLRPKLFITVELILWPNLIIELNKLGIKTMLLGGYGKNLDKDAAHYMISKKLLQYFLSKIDFLGVCSQEDFDEIIKLGVDKKKLGITGHLRLDRPKDFPEVDEKEKILESLRLDKSVKVIVAASTCPGEEQIFLKVFKDIIKTRPHSVMVMAVRDMHRVKEVCDLIQNSGMVFKKRSCLNERDVECGGIIVLDSLGELARILGIAGVTIVGGSFTESTGGGGNIAEPLYRGSPIVVGPHTCFWGPIVDEMKIKRARNHEELKEIIEYFLNNPREAARYCDYALGIINRHRGAHKRCVGEIEKVIYR